MDKVSFGFEDVPPDEKTRRVGKVFANVASRYDLMNDLMSGGMHRLWKAQFVRRVKPRKGEAILDMAGGTGDIAFLLAATGAQVTVADISPEMLEVGTQAGGEPGDRGPELGGRECREPELSRSDLRRLHDRLRDQERDPRPEGAGRSVPGPPNSAAVSSASNSRRRPGRASAPSTIAIRCMSCRGSEKRWRGTRKAIATWSN